MARQYSIHHVQGKHLTFKDREIIQTRYNGNLRLPLKDRKSIREMAAELGLPQSTLAREIRRGIVSTPNTYKDADIWDYSAQKAQDDTDAKTMNRGCGMKMTTYIAERLRYLIVDLGRSPYDARQKLLAEGLPYVPSVSTIYNHIEHNDIGIRHGQTPYHPSERRKRRGSPRKPFNNAGGLSIEDRPDISDRKEFGHWEMDTVVSCVGGRGGLLVLIERSTRYYLVAKVRSISQQSVTNALGRILRTGAMKKVLSVTTDNGCEFLDHAAMEAQFRRHGHDATVYYTHAYAAWEKGSVENANRMVRRWYRKGTDFNRVGAASIAELQDFINSIARKVSLEGKTAHEAYSAAA